MDLFEDLNEEQRLAVDHLYGSILVMAPVGTGKTKVITHRAANAIRNGTNPEKILCLSFTNKAAREMKQRVLDFLGTKARKIKVSTFHSFCNFILRCESDALGINSDFAVYDEEDSKDILAEIVRNYNITVPGEDVDRFYTCLYDFIEEVKISPYKQKTVNSIDEIFFSVIRKQFFRNLDREQAFYAEDIFNEYNRILAENHVLDFTDLIVNVLTLFNTKPEILSRWQNTYDWIQVDEVQDTDIPQYLILSALAREHRNLSFFGDIDQTIYEWRGASPYKLLELFSKDFTPVTEIKFIKNYRSTKNILSVCRAIIQEYLDAATSDLEAVSDEEGDPVIFTEQESPEDEANWIAAKIIELKDEIKYKNIAVLTRAHRINVPISEVFEKCGIPHFIVEQFRFFRRTEIKDALAYMNFLVNSYDTNSLKRILAKPPKGIGEVTIEKIKNCPENAGLRLVDFLKPASFDFSDPYGDFLNNFSNNNIVVFDVETTGLDVFNDDIIELAALKTGKNGIKETFHRYIKPYNKSVGTSENIHGITDEFLLENGEEPLKVLSDFQKFSNGCLLAGHNVSFDLNILNSQLRKLNLNSNGYSDFFDTLDSTRRFFKFRSYTLVSICKELNIPLLQAHKAIDDVKATEELIQILSEKIIEYREIRENYILKYKKYFGDLSNQIKNWKKYLKIKRPAEVLIKILEESGLNEYFKKQANGERRLGNLNELLGLFKHYDDENLCPYDSMINILNMASLGKDADRYMQSDNRVLLLSVHQAKGLEFDAVFLAGISDNLFPSWLSQRQGKIDEEHRLFYVAITRAKKKLFLSFSKFNENGRYQKYSRFIDMIPDELIMRL